METKRRLFLYSIHPLYLLPGRSAARQRLRENPADELAHGRRRGGEPVGVLAVKLFLEFLDLEARAGKVGVDLQRPLQGLEGGPFLTHLQINQTEAGQRAEMARLEGEGALDILDR